MSVQIETGICGDAQESSFMNGTLQSGGTDWEFTIQTFLDFDPSWNPMIEATLAGLIRTTLEEMVFAIEQSDLPVTASFEVQVGPQGAGPDDEYDDDERGDE